MRSTRSRHSSSYRSSRRRATRSRLEVGADDLPPPDAVLADQAGPLEHGDVLLHRREAHRVVAGQLGDALLAVDRAAHDVTPGGIAQCAEDAVVVEGDLHRYNHTVVHPIRQLHGFVRGRDGIPACPGYQMKLASYFDASSTTAMTRARVRTRAIATFLATASGASPKWAA